MIDIIKNRTLDANFKKLKLIPNEELLDYRVQISGPSTYIPRVVEKNTGEPANDTHVVLLDTVTNELRVFEWTTPPPANVGVGPMYYGVGPLVFDYSGRYVLPPVAMHPAYLPNGQNSPCYTQDELFDGTFITMFQPHGPDSIEPMLSIEGQVLKDQTKLKTVTFKRVTLQNQMDGKGVTWRLLNNYICIVQESSAWYHSNAGLAPLTIDQAIEIGLNPIIGLCDSNSLHGLESKWIAHALTHHPMVASENVVIPYDGSAGNQGHYAQPAHAFQEVYPQHFPHPNQAMFGEAQPTKPMPKGYRSNNY